MIERCDYNFMQPFNIPNMTYFLLTVVVVSLYGLLAIGTYTGILLRWRLIKPLALLAVMGHAYLLHQGIDSPAGQNLSVTQLFSLIAWLAAFILLLGQRSLPIMSLGLLVYPIAAFALLLVACSPGSLIIPTSLHPWVLFHILWSTIVVGLFVISGCQAALLGIQEQLLHRKKLTGFLERLPPLQLMETLLFTVVKWGVLALTLLLISSFFLLQTPGIPGLWSKIILAVCVWFVFTGLLAGRHFLGWRGNTAIVWTVIGVVLSVAVYLGSHFLLLM